VIKTTNYRQLPQRTPEKLLTYIKPHGGESDFTTKQNPLSKELNSHGKVVANRGEENDRKGGWNRDQHRREKFSCLKYVNFG